MSLVLPVMHLSQIFRIEPISNQKKKRIFQKSEVKLRLAHFYGAVSAIWCTVRFADERINFY